MIEGLVIGAVAGLVGGFLIGKNLGAKARAELQKRVSELERFGGAVKSTAQSVASKL